VDGREGGGVTGCQEGEQNELAHVDLYGSKVDDLAEQKSMNRTQVPSLLLHDALEQAHQSIGRLVTCPVVEVTWETLKAQLGAVLRHISIERNRARRHLAAACVEPPTRYTYQAIHIDQAQELVDIIDSYSGDSPYWPLISLKYIPYFALDMPILPLIFHIATGVAYCH